MGERTPPKTDGFWISFRRRAARSDPSEMWNRRISLCAAAFALKCAAIRFYRIQLLSGVRSTPALFYAQNGQHAALHAEADVPPAVGHAVDPRRVVLIPGPGVVGQHRQ